VGSNDQVLTADSAQSAGVKWAAAGSGSGSARNYVINGDFQVAQRGTSFTSATSPANNDDTYLLDQWILLSDGNDVVDVTQNTDSVPTNGLYAIRLDVETANKKFGILQVLEQKNAIGVIGEEVTLSFKAKTAGSGKIDNIKAAIIAWDGTADTVTSDIISAWGTEDTDPTLVANWTYENDPADLNPTTSWATYSVTATVDTASTKNVGVFIWSDVTDVDVGDFLYIADVQFEVGATASDFARRPYWEELELCKRYFQVFGGVTNYPLATGAYISTTAFDFPLILRPNMRTTPTGSASGTTVVTAASNSADRASSAIAYDYIANDLIKVRITTGAATAGHAGFCRIPTATDWIRFTAEL
jgi:hypothetical protein